MSIRAAALVLIPILAGAHEAAAQAPISAIQWLDDADSLAALVPQDRNRVRPDPRILGEPPVSQSALVPDVAVKPLDELGDGPLGLMPTGVTGLPETLWRGSDPERVIRMIEGLDLENLPAMQSLLYSLLLTETLPPAAEGQRPDMLLARVDALTQLGSVDPALALLEHAGAESHPDLFRRYFDLALLAGLEGEACQRLAARPDLSPDYASRVYCLARMGDWQAAMVTFSSMVALDEFAPREETLLQLFLEPELIEGMPQLAPSSKVTPLVFRLEEAIGQPLSTAALPRAYATADLRNVSGWKAELEAVERLARTGAVSENRLIGVYGERRPAASGGIWDRVAAVQAFDAAMQRGDAEEVANTITAAWAAMREAGLQVPFARLYGADLIPMTLDSRPAQRTALRIALLSPAYEAAAQTMPAEGREEVVLTALARGQTDGVPAPSARARAVAAGFAPGAQPIPRTFELAQENRLGEAILQAMELYARAAAGDYKNATEAFATLRAVGLEDTARRAALQMLILDSRS
ncbi:hypothetical protein [Pseudooceanicola nanhaiensis]|uniref:hypothetical protein n=1 Tax=Pseudooceanicola nanhaiensis TaxID=375761 RepID=UPI00405A1DB2